MLLFEGREVVLPFSPSPYRIGQVVHGTLQRLGVWELKPVKPPLKIWQQGLVLILVELAGLLKQRQHLVVDKTHTPEMMGKELFLLFARIDSILVRFVNQHGVGSSVLNTLQ